ncbi:MAG: LPXTG cell wall anchor domain-containing protein, partial [Eubacteriales bacterium]|nr:LPXTG cell wall anchor domain-containing protein [Eubacteriales bacterium]
TEEETQTEEEQTETELTAEEQAQVDKVIALINALPTPEEIGNTLADFGKAGDEDGYDAYLAQVVVRAKAAHEAYEALSEAQKRKVTNAVKLMELEPLWSVQTLSGETETTGLIRLFKYAEDNGVDAGIIISKGSQQIKPNSDGSYDVIAGEEYNIRIFYGPATNGMKPGRYYVSFLSTTDVDWNQGKRLTLTDNNDKETDVGEWYFQREGDDSDSWWMIFDINENITNFSDVTLVADVAYKFDYTDEPIKFDGNITVNVKRDEDQSETKVSKWASDSGTDFGTGKIAWGSEIYGHSESKIVGQKLTDTITTTDTHYYTEDDKKKGICFTAYQYNGHDSRSTGFETIGAGHSWTVKEGDANLTWTDTGWSYIMPEKISCTDCNKEITLGDENWYYYFSYTSTVRSDLGEGSHLYKNKIAIDGAEENAEIDNGGKIIGAGIVKTVEYSHKEGGEGNDLYANDTIDWTLTVTIPGSTGDKFNYFWYVYDSLRVFEGSKSTHWENPLNNVTVTAKIGDSTAFTVPKYGTDEAKNAVICWRPTWSGADEAGVTYIQQIDFYTQCKCTEENCATWNWKGTTGCYDRKTDGDGNFCRCWSLTEDTVITFHYSTPVNNKLTETYGGMDAILQNKAELNNKQKMGETFESVLQDEDTADIDIPGEFTKKQTEEPDEDNSYQAEYTITVNEGKANLSNSNQEVTITDTMTGALNFIPSTLKVFRTNSAGIVETLTKEMDYTYIYKQGEKNVLEITLWKSALGPYQYTLVYEATVSGDATYKNSADITLNGKTYMVDGDVYNTPEAMITGQRYGITLQKYDEDTDQGLNDAVFALYEIGTDENGKETESFVKNYTSVYDRTLNKNGIIQIVTNSVENVTLQEHVLYYVKEIQAPPGYTLDENKHYFWFCNDDNKDKKCDDYGDAYGPESSYKATLAFVHNPNEINFKISNAKSQEGYELPETGGTGTVPYTTGGLLVIGTSLFLWYRKKGRKEDFASF